MCTITDLKISAASAGGCSSSISGIQKVWIFDCDSIDVEDIVVTEGTGTCRVTGVTFAAANSLGEFEFSQNKTATYIETMASEGAAVDLAILVQYEGISPERIKVLNELKSCCCLGAFVEYKSGLIRMIGYDYDGTTDTVSQIPTPLKLKGSTNSGTGNGDKELTIFELIGQGKCFMLDTTLTASDLNAL